MRLSEWKALKQMQTDDVVSQEIALKCITENDTWMPVLWSHVGTLKPGAGFKEAAENVMRVQVYATMFEEVLKMGEALRTGFIWAVASLQGAEGVMSPVSLKRILTQAKKTQPEQLQFIFGASVGVEVEQFLTVCTYDRLPKFIIDRFKIALERMTYGERSRLAQFVTDSKYFSFDAITIIGFAEWDHKRLPQAMMCTNTLQIAFYDSDEDMQFKLSVASMHLGYGFS